MRAPSGSPQSSDPSTAARRSLLDFGMARRASAIDTSNATEPTAVGPGPATPDDARIGALPEGRFAPDVETAAYTVVAEAARTAAGGITVGATCDGAALIVEVDAPAGGVLELVQLEDRVGAIDGRLAVEPRNGRIAIRAELPCNS